MFTKPDGYGYEPGQYVEMILEHDNVDDRGTTRWFTLSSSPTEAELTITIRRMEKHSSYKQALFDLGAGDAVQIKPAAGEFILPPDNSRVLVWIAGGIGVTPFRSQLKFLLDNEESLRDITLIYSNRTYEDICFAEIWQEAQDKFANFKLVETLVESWPASWSGEKGLIDEAMILRAVGSVQGKDFYMSGPAPMIDGFKPKLLAMGIDEHSIHQDWFPNYTEEFFKI